MPDTSDADVIVIGGGLSGLMAANRVSQLGKSAIVLEKGTEEKYRCNSRYTGGTFHVCLNDVMSGEDVLLKAIETSTAGFARKDLAVAVAKEGPRAVRWLQGEGGKFIKGSAATYQNWVIAPPPARTQPGLDWEGRGGDVLLQTLEKNLLKRGGRVLRGVRARTLVMRDGKCIGVEAETPEGSKRFNGSAIVIADGGFQGDAELVKKYITSHPEKLKQRGAGTGAGDGLRMAEAAGAAIVGTNRFYGHLLSVDALKNDKLWPYPYMDALAAASLVVNADGERFTDEGKGGVYIANMIAELDNPLDACLIFDKAAWEGPGSSRHVPPNPHLLNAGGTLHSAPDLDALAALIKVSADRLRKTVSDYNNAVASNSTSALSPPRTAEKYKPLPIALPPFYAMPLCVGITNTMGGISVDAAGHVLNAAGAAIRGLFAVGCATGGLEGGPAAGYVGGLAKSGVTALLAAEAIAQA